MPRGGRFLLNALRAFPFHPPPRLAPLPGCPAPPLLAGPLPKGFSPLSPFLSSDLIGAHFCPLPAGILSFLPPSAGLAPWEVLFLHIFSSWGRREVAGGCTEGAGAPPAPPGLPRLQVSSAPSSHPAARRRGAQLGSSRPGTFAVAISFYVPSYVPQRALTSAQFEMLQTSSAPGRARLSAGVGALKCEDSRPNAWVPASPCPSFPAVGHGRSATFHLCPSSAKGPWET